MSDVEKAKALLQAAGLSGVAVGEAETVTMSKAEADALGHSDPGFTLRTYVHLIDDGLGDADFLDGEGWATSGATRPTFKQANAGDADLLKVAV